MIKLNLTNHEKSDLKYVISKFPSGQQNITINLKEGTFLSKLTELGTSNR